MKFTLHFHLSPQGLLHCITSRKYSHPTETKIYGLNKCNKADGKNRELEFRIILNGLTHSCQKLAGIEQNYWHKGFLYGMQQQVLQLAGPKLNVKLKWTTTPYIREGLNSRNKQPPQKKKIYIYIHLSRRVKFKLLTHTLTFEPITCFS